MFTLDNTWITSDLHLGHENVLSHDGRPFGNIEEMDEAITYNFRELIGPEDNLFILGDAAWQTKSFLKFYDSLRTKNVYYVKGNHEKALKKKWHLFKEVHSLCEVLVQGIKLPIVMCHYPLEEWNRSYYGAWHLHGHRHGSVADNPNIYRLDMSINLWDYLPVKLNSIKEVFNKNIKKSESPKYWEKTKRDQGPNPNYRGSLRS